MWLLTPVTSLCQPAAHAEDEDAGGTRDRRTHHASPGPSSLHGRPQAKDAGGRRTALVTTKDTCAREPHSTSRAASVTAPVSGPPRCPHLNLTLHDAKMSGNCMLMMPTFDFASLSLTNK